jgi:hypothetical protein
MSHATRSTTMSFSRQYVAQERRRWRSAPGPRSRRTSWLHDSDNLGGLLALSEHLAGRPEIELSNGLIETPPLGQCLRDRLAIERPSEQLSCVSQDVKHGDDRG